MGLQRSQYSAMHVDHGFQGESISIKNKRGKVLKRKYDNDTTEFGGGPSDYSQGFRKGFDEDTSNRSSSGSAISNSESCAQYGSADASDLTGPSQPTVWDTMVPSRKRTCVTRPKPSPVEKLTKDLYTIWHEQQSSCLSASSEEELLLESDKPIGSVEFGHGSVLIRHPSSIAREEESEASSLSIDHKRQSLNSRLVAFPGLIEDKSANLSSQGIDKIKRPANPGIEQERIRRDKDQLEKLQIMAHHNSPLCYIDLQDVLNFDNFASHLTNEERQQLLKLLPSVDTLEAPDRCAIFFCSLPQSTMENLDFLTTLSDLKIEDCKILKKFVLCNLTKSKWVEQFKTFKESKGKNIMNESEVAGESNTLATDSSLSVKKPREGMHRKLSGDNATMGSPRRIMVTSNYDQKELIDKGCSFFSPKRLFSSHNDDSSQVLDSTHFADESSEQDLLLDVPSNGSFPQAELLLPSSSFGAQASTSSSSVYPNFVRP
ncbi:UNVERIFIED_CONTAM: GATA transcription factor 26 [Sesamum latifolium]|uniref:GATA transcription factor 26 n=1 Tax=Sesamum latifolium TaxID=2727402 RepID=A0AAW2WZK5_9LAMI